MKTLPRHLPRPNRLAAATALAAAATLAVTGCSSSAAGSASKTVNVVAFSTPKPAYDALQAAFTKTSQGKGVSFSSSYDASGTQSKAVESGKPADYVNFSTGPDMTRLVPKFVDSGWDSGSTKGIVADSVVVIVVRKGNPKHIEGWNDLIKPGVQIVTPDPASSGSAKWNLLAAYEQVIAQGGSPSDAKDYLTKFFKNVVSKPSSGSDAAATFQSGTGDALISYESEAISARQKGVSEDYIVPDQTVLIQTPAAVTKNAPTAAKDFLNYAESDAGQKIFAENGWRPAAQGVSAGSVKGAMDESNPYPTPSKLITVDSIGGWDKVNDEFFGDPNGIVTKIEGSSG